MKKWWITRRTPGEEERFEHVSADTVEVVSGALVFKKSGSLRLVLAPGEWISLHVDPEDDA